MSGRWSLSGPAFEGLLRALSPDREEAGRAYERLRLKLVKYFDWRGCRPAEDHADEVLNRVARRLEEGIAVENMGSYVYGVARFVRSEAIKKEERERTARAGEVATVADESTERVADCLESCLAGLAPRSRDLIVAYYQERGAAQQEARRALAGRLGLPLNALRIRAHRIRAVLKACVARCVETDERPRGEAPLVDEG